MVKRSLSLFFSRIIHHQAAHQDINFECLKQFLKLLVSSALPSWLRKVSNILASSHFVSLFSSPVILLGYTLMTAEQLER